MTEEPTLDTLRAWADAGGSEATDGCWLPANREACEHGFPSWAIVLGVAAPLGDD